MRKIVLLQLILIASVLISCTDELDNAEINNSQSDQLVLTSDEYASIAYDNPQELSENEIANVIYDFKHINSEFKKQFVAAAEEEKPKVFIRNKYYLKNNATRSRSADSLQINVPIFEVELTKNDGKKDVTVVCGDERAPKVMFYAENYKSSMQMNMEMNYLVELAKLSILSDIEYIENLKSEKRTSTLNKISKALNISKELITKNIIKREITIADSNNAREYNPINGIDINQIPSRIVSMVPPMSDIIWKQSAPYNYQMPIGPMWDGGFGVYDDYYLVGCGNIAIATLFSILRPSMVGETSTGKQILIDWDYLTSQKSITYTSPAKMIEMAGSLLRTIYNKTQSFPDFIDIKTYDEDNQPIIKRGIASTSTSPSSMLDYLQTMTTFSGDVGFNPDIAKQSLLNYNPILLFGSGHFVDNNHQLMTGKEYNYNPGHGWIIDGYCTTKKAGLPTNDLYWSVNMGWGNGSSNVYFKTSNNVLDCDVIFRYNEEANVVYYTQEQRMIYDIQKK